MGICRGWRSPLFFSLLPLVLFLPLILSVLSIRSMLQVHNRTFKLGMTFRLQQIIQSTTTPLDRILLGYVMVTVANSTYSKAERSIGILNVLVDFIQVINYITLRVSIPRSSIIVLTDPASDFTINRSNTTILPILGDYSQGNLLLQRISSYIAYLEGRLQEHSKGLRIYSHYIFTDSDIAVVDDLGNIFHKYPDFHLVLTFRSNKYQPLNSGFIAVRGTADGIYTAKIFFEEVLNVYSLKFMKASRILGDQLALPWVVESHLPFSLRKCTMHEAFSGEINGVYNWTPPEGAGQFHGMPLDVQVSHFKGSRKRLMLPS
ncbi:unnamed protein product [Musa hybrid cultivar]